MIKPYLTDIINDHKAQGEWNVHSGNEVINYKTQGEWKFQLTMTISFIFSKDSDVICTMHRKSNNIEIMMSNETNEIIEEVFESRLQRYQKALGEKMRRSEFVFDSVDFLHYNLHKISLNRDGSYILLNGKKKKSTINPKNNDGKCFLYAVTVTLSYQNIKNNPETVLKIKPFIEQHDWKEIDFPSPTKN